jgi:hypothetical protein
MGKSITFRRDYLSETELANLQLQPARHPYRELGVSALEAVAWLAGERHSDSPRCVCPVISSIVRRWSEVIDTASRQKLKPLLPRLVGTAWDRGSEARARLAEEIGPPPLDDSFLALLDRMIDLGIAQRMLLDVEPRIYTQATNRSDMKKTLKTDQSLIRQGDVMFVPVRKLPAGERRKRDTGTVAFGEATGHHHSLIAEDLERAEVLEIGEGLFVHVSEHGVRLEGATFAHQEHGPVTLPPGDYEVIIQREYSPEAIRNVID